MRCWRNSGPLWRALKLGVSVALAAFYPSVPRVTAQTRAPQVQSVRLYVLDCGVLVRGEPTAYNLTREQVGDTNFSDACYLVVHPKGTLLWDVGNDNKEQTRASRDRIDALLQKTGAQLWIQHDIIANAKLKKSPLFYD